MSPYWVEFSDRTGACFEALSPEDAMESAKAHGTPVKAGVLPYPATPQLGDWISTCPPFCFQPQKCVGRGSCPRSRACDD